jgi:hypothetical protein
VQKLFFVAFVERPTEVPAKAFKKRFLQKRLERKAGNGSSKNY